MNKGSTGFHRSTGNPRKPWIFTKFFGLLRYFFDFWSNIKDLGWKNMFLSFSTRNHAESFRNFVNISVLDPKCAKFNKSRDFVMSGLAKTCPGGQVLTASHREYYFLEITPSFRFLSPFSFQKIHLSIFINNLITCLRNQLFYQANWSFYKIICFINQIYHFS